MTQPRSILITGGAGFVGSNLVGHLVRVWPECAVTVLDSMRYRLGERNLAEVSKGSSQVRVIEGSVTDRSVVDELVADAEVLVHLAVETADEERFLEVQLTGTKMLLDAARRHRVRRIVLQSTADVYGICEADDLVEDDPVRTTTLYAATKLGAEALATAYHHLYGLPVAIVRPVSIYGPRQYPGWLVSRFIALALAGEPLPIMGDGTVRRDWLHVDDVCRALLALSACDDPVVDGAVFNLGTGTERTVLEVAGQILALVGRPASQVRYLPARVGDSPRQVTRAAKARKLLGWQARVPFPDGLRDTIVWYREHRGWLAEQTLAANTATASVAGA
jgi:dTDP-glucose 4,6-dehydratase